MGECDPSIEEIPENEVNVATRKINSANAPGVRDWEERTGPKNALVSSIPDSADEDCAAMRRCDGILST